MSGELWTAISPAWLFLVASIFFLSMNLIELGSGQFPTSCINDAALKTQTCCPIADADGMSMMCGGPRRGKCRKIEDNYCHREPLVPNSLSLLNTMTYLLDQSKERSRYPWPTRFFNKICICRGQWFGPDCTECKYGFIKRHSRHRSWCVRRPTPVVRRNILDLSPADRKYARELVAKLRDRTQARSSYAVLVNDGNFGRSKGEPSNVTVSDFRTDLSVYDFLVWVHYFSAKDGYTPFNNYNASTSQARDRTNGTEATGSVNDADDMINFSHNGPAFLTWHRHFMLWFERELQHISGNTSFAMPYWNWLDDRTRGQLFNRPYPFALTRDGLTGVFENFTVFCDEALFSVPEDEDHHDRRTPRRGDASLCKEFYSHSPIERNFSTQPDMQHLPSYNDLWDVFAASELYDRPDFDMDAPLDIMSGFRPGLEGFVPLPGKSYCLHGNGTKPGSDSVFELHNNVHNFARGTMRSGAGSANDPLFWLHHAQVDRLLELFIQKLVRRGSVKFEPQSGAAPGHNANDCLVPFFPLQRNKDFIKSSQELGYVYDHLPDMPGPPRKREEMSQCKAGSPAKMVAAPKSMTDEVESLSNYLLDEIFGPDMNVETEQE